MNNLDKQYQQLLQDIIDYGVEKKDRTGTGTKSIFGYTIRHNMKDGFPLLTTKRMAWKSIVTELLWFLQGDTNIKYLVDNGCHIWDGDAYKNYLNVTKHEFQLNSAMSGHPHFNLKTKEDFIEKIKTDERFAKEYGELGPIYGKQWRQWQGWVDVPDVSAFFKGSLWFDQIQRLIHMLKTEPDSRRLMVNAWNVADLDKMVLPPCHYGFQVYTRELSHQERSDLKNSPPYNYGKPANGKLINERLLDSNNVPTRAISLMWNQRSVDTFLGLPFNIASYGLLLTLLGKLVNMVPEQVIGNLGDTHLYLNHIEQATEQKSRQSYELPWVELNFDFKFKDGYIVDWGNINVSDIELVNYLSAPSLKAPLSN
jgi:thymidylate synthase